MSNFSKLSGARLLEVVDTAARLALPAGALRVGDVVRETGRPEIFTVQAVADVAGSLNSTYFTFSLGGTSYYAWLNIDAGGSDPAPSGTGIEVAAASDDDATAIATALESALNGAGLAATISRSTDTVTVTATDVGAQTGAADDGGTGFAITVTQEGVDAGAVYEVTDPALAGAEDAFSKFGGAGRLLFAATLSGTQAVSDRTATVVAFDTVTLGGANWDAGTFTFTASEDGTYFINASSLWHLAPDPTDYCSYQLYVYLPLSLTAFEIDQRVFFPPPAENTHADNYNAITNGACIVQLAAGDQVQILVNCYAGAEQGLLGLGGTFVQIAKL